MKKEEMPKKEVRIGNCFSLEEAIEEGCKWLKLKGIREMSIMTDGKNITLKLTEYE